MHPLLSPSILSNVTLAATAGMLLRIDSTWKTKTHAFGVSEHHSGRAGIACAFINC
jgi:hypothetical protein